MSFLYAASSVQYIQAILTVSPTGPRAVLHHHPVLGVVVRASNHRLLLGNHGGGQVPLRHLADPLWRDPRRDQQGLLQARFRITPGK